MAARSRLSRRTLAAAGLGALAGAAAQPRLATAADRPHIVLVLTDDMRADDLGDVRSVRDRVAAQGTTFRRAFTTTPLCSPSRASILRGQYAHNHGVLGNTGDDAGFETLHGKGLEASTVATWLQAAGYRTGLVGKYINGYASKEDPAYVPPGWETWVAAIDHAAYSQYDYALNENGTITKHGHKAADYLTTVVGDRAETFIAQAASDPRPMFLYVAPFAPHAPSTPPPGAGGGGRNRKPSRGASFNEADVGDKPAWVRATQPMSRSQIRKVEANAGDRQASLHGVSDLVDRVLDALAAVGAADNAWLFFTSDNGVFLGEHRQAHGKNGPYDEATRVPLVASGPGARKGATVDRLALNIDLAPTFAEIAGARLPDFADGRSLLPLLAGGSRDWREEALLEGFGGTGHGSADSVPPFAALRGEDHLYVEYKTGERELYDLAHDPAMLTNLARSADKATLAASAKRLAKMRRAGGGNIRGLEDVALSIDLPQAKDRQGAGGKRAAGRDRPARAPGTGRGRRAGADRAARREARRARRQNRE